MSSQAPYKRPSKPDRDAENIYDQKIAQDRELKIYQTGSFATNLHTMMPTGGMVTVVKFNRNASETNIIR